MTKTKPMSARKFRAALDELGLTIASQRTARLLGFSVRQVQRLAVGGQPVPRPIELLLQMYLKYGIDDE